MNNWISVKDQLPKEYKDVLAIGEEGIVIAQYYGEEFGGWGTTMNRSVDHVTHWQPLPALPEQSNAAKETVKQYIDYLSKQNGVLKEMIFALQMRVSKLEALSNTCKHAGTSTEIFLSNPPKMYCTDCGEIFLINQPKE